MTSSRSTNSSQIAAWISLLGSFAVLSLKLTGYYRTHSQAILSDALESVVNIVTACVALIIMRAVEEPADKEHPYGHGKMEYFSSAFEGGMIVLAGLMIAVESVLALVNQSRPQLLEQGMVFIGIASVINFLLGLYLKKIANRYQSEALLASSTHVMADVWTTLGIVVGLVLVRVTGWNWLDPVIALVVGVLLLFSGYKIVRRSFGVLLDEADTKALETLSVAIEKHRQPGLIDVHDARMIRAGKFHHIDAHLVVPEFWTALQVNDMATDFEKKVIGDYPFHAEIAFHVDPCRREFCENCNYEPCGIRKKKFVQLRPINAISLIETAHEPQS